MWSKCVGIFGFLYGIFYTFFNGWALGSSIVKSPMKSKPEKEQEKSMNSWGRKSQKGYDSLNTDLMRLCDQILGKWDCSILWGFRNKERQEGMVATGNSQLHFPFSKHNRYPSAAVDLCPYPIPDWEKDTHVFRTFGGYVLGVADTMGIKIRWGGDWDGDKDLNDQTFNDLVHFELIR